MILWIRNRFSGRACKKRRGGESGGGGERSHSSPPLPVLHELNLSTSERSPKALPRRGAVRYLLTVALSLAYLALAFALPFWGLGSGASALFALFAALSFVPVRRRLQKIADRVLFGGWYDYRSVASEMSQALAGVVDVGELRIVLVERLRELMRVKGAELLLPDEEGNLGRAEENRWLPARTFPRLLPRSSALAGELLSASRPLSSHDLAVRLGAVELSEGERGWLSEPDVELWVPLVRRGAFGTYILGKLQGILLLGHKAGGETYDAEDRRLLGTLAWEAAVAAENVELFSALRRRADEINRLYGQVVASREEERKRIARELHDRVIQELIDLLFAVDAAAAGSPERSETLGLRGRLREVIDGLRDLCSELRPSALDDLSFPLAVQGYVEEMRKKSGLAISLTLPLDADESLESLPEPVPLSLFRVLQEGLLNAHRHSGAKEVRVGLSVDAHRILLEVTDDGRGFACPPSWGELLREGHFGLAGASERMSLIGGKLEVESSRDGGTTLRASVPHGADRVG